ncbi:hypothetical protein SPBR_02132 [Sporothrix brasiliensis 5110]|uniref:Uncharacterized protein n=1 Tax=Sporothrix brasiliensis 5110 TaxID=1398154 RepID=A0A0C2FKH7_9PEZI|nr:uncharacterized protein SPBR_02132 [Sporothrix brasiliensis 5110]KIH91578.1 hypothetical protein SPBR_02132 [Sporothrix brasiliensis 5110]
MSTTPGVFASSQLQYPTPTSLRPQNTTMWSENSGQGKPLSVPEVYLQPPTPILRARELPDYTKFPPPASFM